MPNHKGLNPNEVCSAKTRYSKREAEEVCKRTYSRELRPYNCPQCHYWHTATVNQNEKRPSSELRPMSKRGGKPKPRRLDPKQEEE